MCIVSERRNSMGTGTLGALNVVLSADTAQFNSAMTKAAFTAERELQKISRSAKLNGAVMTAALVAAATAFTVKMKHIIDDADEIGKMAQKLGLSTEELSKLKYAAEISGVSIEQLGVAMSKLNKNAVAGSAAFASLGIELKNSDGTLRSNTEILGDIAERFSKFKDNATKSAMAMEIFGKSGAEIIPLLNSGKSGLDAMGAEAERLGIVFSTKTAKSAEQFNDNMTRLSKNVEGISLSIGSGLLPVLVQLSETMKSSNNETSAFSVLGKSLGAVLILVANRAMEVNQAFKDIGNGIADVAFAATQLAQGKFKEAFETMRKDGQDSAEGWAKISTDVNKMWESWDGKAQQAAASVSVVTQSMEEQAKTVLKVSELHFKAAATTKRLSDAAKDVGSAFQSSFEDAIIEGKKFSDMLGGLLKDIERVILRTMVTGPLADAISSGLGSLFQGGTGLAAQTKNFGGGIKPYTAPVFSAHGNVFANGNIQAFANGGVIGGPMMWPMSGGKTGLAGEAGKEAILPLTRTPSGDLGVKTSGASKTVVNVYAPPGSNVSQDSQQDGSIERINIYIDEAVAGNVSKPGSKTHKALKSTFGASQVLTKR